MNNVWGWETRTSYCSESFRLLCRKDHVSIKDCFLGHNYTYIHNSPSAVPPQEKTQSLPLMSEGKLKDSSFMCAVEVGSARTAGWPEKEVKNTSPHLLPLMPHFLRGFSAITCQDKRVIEIARGLQPCLVSCSFWWTTVWNSCSFYVEVVSTDREPSTTVNYLIPTSALPVI